MAKATESGNGTRVNDIAEASLKLAGLIDRWFRLGRYPLIAVGIGTVFTFFYMIAMQISGLKSSLMLPEWRLVFFLAVLLLAGGFGTAAVGAVLAHRNAHKLIGDYKKTIGAAHRLSAESIQSVRQLNQLLLVHADTVANVLDAARPVLTMFGAEPLANSRYLHSDIAAFSQYAEEAIARLDKAIADADFATLAEYGEGMGKLATKTKSTVALVKSSDLVEKFRSNANNARDAALAFNSCVSEVHARIARTAESIDDLRSRAQTMPVLAPLLTTGAVGEYLDSFSRVNELLDATEEANRRYVSRSAHRNPRLWLRQCAALRCCATFCRAGQT